jgi:alpha-ketoglutarate-dependent taurine dioxygenase
MTRETDSAAAVAPAVVRPSVLRSAIKVAPVVPALGAELSNVSLADAAEDADLFTEIRRLLLIHKVLFFRDQDLTAAQHNAFAERFGPLEDHPVAPSHPEFPKLLLLYREKEKQTYENCWHTDATWREHPPMGSILRCESCPEFGGDTLWANMVLAYEKLPEHIKRRIAGLRARHSIEHSFGGPQPPERRAELAAAFPSVEHPVVRTHPETGEKALFVNQGFTTHFVNFHNWDDIRYGQDFSIEANQLMNYLFAQASIPEFQVRLRWRPNTVAIWDNRCTQHYAVHDYYPEPRRMVRATVIGDRPF